ncbi:MAG: Holliday junction branch migration protein RuvA [Candidatus Kapabacteria bacterium]|nr:Holliday junction branch migration protein RuvA [Candidatus Kapabacteria bacterium]
MIAQLTGLVAHKDAMDVVIDCQGVGYAVSVSLTTADIVPNVGDRVTLYTILAVREDAMQLFGFASTAERAMFTLLTSIQGIGGKTALGILSTASIADLRKAVATGNVAALQRLPGIGKKTAERLVVELREKVIAIVPEGAPTADIPSTRATEDAISALMALGFARTAAERSVATAVSADPSLVDSPEQLIRAALRS